MSVGSQFQVSDDLNVICFRRDGCSTPYFAVREFDTKIIRASPSKNRKGRGPSEQAIRASIRQAILNMNLKSERATKAEIRQLKMQGILGKRAPSCSLLSAEDMIKLLMAFGKDSYAREFRDALERQHSMKLSLKSRSRSFSMSSVDTEVHTPTPKRRRLMSAPANFSTGLDALLFAAVDFHQSESEHEDVTDVDDDFKFPPQLETYDTTNTSAEPQSPLSSPPLSPSPASPDHSSNDLLKTEQYQPSDSYQSYIVSLENMNCSKGPAFIHHPSLKLVS